jgi:hypothetical protein
MMDDTERKRCFISFGLVSCFDKSRMIHDITPEHLHYLESFLINTKKPFGNDPSTKKGYKGDATIVFNGGNNGSFGKIMTNNEVIINFLKTKL